MSTDGTALAAPRRAPRRFCGRTVQGDLRRKTLITLGAAALAVAAGGCSTLPQQGAQPAVPRPSPSSARPVAANSPTAVRTPHRSGSLRVLTEPGDGIEPIYQLITAARSSVDLTIYELADPIAEADLAADVARGVMSA
jgi:hypothetical protein